MPTLYLAAITGNAPTESQNFDYHDGMASHDVICPPLNRLAEIKMTKKTTKETNMLALDNQFCFALYSASLALTKTYKPLLEALNLTYPQYLVMLVLWEQDDVLVKEIGQALFLDSGTLTPLLKRLESAGLLIRQRDAQDERQVRIVLTPEGKQLRKAAMAIPPQIVCASGQTLETLISLRQQLNDLREELHGESTDQIA